MTAGHRPCGEGPKLGVGDAHAPRCDHPTRPAPLHHRRRARQHLRGDVGRHPRLHSRRRRATPPRRPTDHPTSPNPNPNNHEASGAVGTIGADGRLIRSADPDAPLRLPLRDIQTPSGPRPRLRLPHRRGDPQRALERRPDPAHAHRPPRPPTSAHWRSSPPPPTPDPSAMRSDRRHDPPRPQPPRSHSRPRLHPQTHQLRARTCANAASTWSWTITSTEIARPQSRHRGPPPTTRHQPLRHPPALLGAPGAPHAARTDIEPADNATRLLQPAQPLALLTPPTPPRRIAIQMRCPQCAGRVKTNAHTRNPRKRCEPAAPSPTSPASPPHTAATASPPSTAPNSPTTRASPTARPRGEHSYSRDATKSKTPTLAYATKAPSTPAHADRSAESPAPSQRSPKQSSTTSTSPPRTEPADTHTPTTTPHTPHDSGGEPDSSHRSHGRHRARHRPRSALTAPRRHPHQPADQHRWPRRARKPTTSTRAAPSDAEGTTN